MEKEPQDEMPFQPLKNDIFAVGGFTDVFEFCENNACVVKELTEYSADSNLADDEAQEIQHYLNIAQEKFPVEYAKFFPKTHCVIGKNKKGKRSLFIVQEKIIGENLTVHLLSEKQQQDFKKLISFLIDIYIETFDGERGSIVQIDSGKNYIFGHKINETEAEDRIYMIDFVPVFAPPLDILKNWLKHVFGEIYFSEQDIQELLDKLDVLKEK